MSMFNGFQQKILLYIWKNRVEFRLKKIKRQIIGFIWCKLLFDHKWKAEAKLSGLSKRCKTCDLLVKKISINEWNVVRENEKV